MTEQILVPQGTVNILPFTYLQSFAATTVVFPRTLINIGRNAFQACTNLDNIEIPATVKTIGQRAFSMCKHLKNIKIPKSVMSIEPYAFEDCIDLEVITIPPVYHLDFNVFSGCENLKEVNISNFTMFDEEGLKALLPGVRVKRYDRMEMVNHSNHN